MAVLVEGISVVIRRAAIESKFPGGWEGFVEDVPNPTLCTDDELARVGFMTPADVKAYVEHLSLFGIQYVEEKKAVDLIVADQLNGFAVDCEWAEFGHVYIGDDPEAHVGACRAVSSESMQIATPNGWQYEKSLSKSYSFVPNEEVNQKLRFLRHENGMDVYLDLETGKDMYLGRASS